MAAINFDRGIRFKFDQGCGELLVSFSDLGYVGSSNMEESGTRVNGIEEDDSGKFHVGVQGNGQDEMDVDVSDVDIIYRHGVGI